jgi:hypothetical protein
LCFSTSVTGETVTEGLDTIVNRRPGPVHVDHATWVHNVGLKPLGISIFHRREGGRFATFGSWRGYPPENLSHDGGPTMAAAWGTAGASPGCDPAGHQ